jgi:DNA polymerase III delta subunit
MLEIMENNRRAIEHELAMLSFYMQGGLGFNEAHMLSADQRKMLSKVIQKHYESMDPKKKGGML